MDRSNATTLPAGEVGGEFPDVNPEDTVVFVACSDDDFRAQGIALAFSLNRYAPGSNIHFHVACPAEDFDHVCGLLLIALSDLHLTVSYEQLTLPTEGTERTEFIACVGVIRLNDVFLSSPARYLSLPVNCLVRGQIIPILDSLPSADLAFSDARQDTIHSDELPQSCLLSPTDAAREFSRVEAGMILEAIRGGAVPAGTAANMCRKAIHDIITPDTGFSMVDLPATLLDPDCAESSIVWYDQHHATEGSHPFRVFFQSIWPDNLEDNIRQAFWRDEESGNRGNVLILSPRLDSSFKRNPLVTSDVRDGFKAAEVVELRRYWAEFAQGIGGAVSRRGANTRTLTLDNWRFSADMINFLNPDLVIVPHRQSFQLDGIRAPAFYYMQIVFRWLFSLDAKGWGAGASEYPFGEYELGDPDSEVYDTYARHLLDNNDSKFPQPKSLDVDDLKRSGAIPDGPYIFFPCQIPHDEVVRFFFDQDEVSVVKALADWASAAGIQLVFKGHPANPTSMEPLRAAGVGETVRWSDASIHDLIRHSAAVYTINSGAGVEVILHGKPLVTFGRAEYDIVSIRADVDALDDAWERVITWDEDVETQKYRRFMDWFCRTYAIDLSDTGNVEARFDRAADKVLSVIEFRE